MATVLIGLLGNEVGRRVGAFATVRRDIMLKAGLMVWGWAVVPTSRGGRGSLGCRGLELEETLEMVVRWAEVGGCGLELEETLVMDVRLAFIGTSPGR